VFGRDRWTAYCGFGQSVAVDGLLASAADLGVETSVTETGRSLLHSSDPSKTVTVHADPEVDVRAIPVAGDPVFRFWNGILGRSEYADGVTLLRVRPYNDQTRSLVRELLAGVASGGPRAPWDLRNHPQFRIAPLLRWRTKRRWQALLEGTE
jgi:hypothetical protein